MKSKTYRHKTYVTTSIYVTVDKKRRKIAFRNGTIHPRKNGFVKVNDPELQKAIEAHPDYKVKFFIEKVNGKSLVDAAAGESKDIIHERKYAELEKKYNTLKDEYDTLMAENEVLTMKLKEAPKVKPPKPEPEKPKDVKPEAPAVKVIEVKNIQEAKEILKGEPYNIVANRMIQEAAVLNRAKEVNVEFRFPE